MTKDVQHAWQPTASIDVLKQRAVILQNIRAFFANGMVMEVETPCLSAFTITDPYLEAMHTSHTLPGASTSSRLYLQTSPEYAMKRLLAAGSGDIFQLTKAFRDDEVGRLHNPEFTILEWYRVGYSMMQLIEEVMSLLIHVLEVDACEQASYCSLFERFLNINPLTASLGQIRELCVASGLADYIASLEERLQFNHALVDNESKEGLSTLPVQASMCAHDATSILLKDSMLQVLFSQKIEPNIGQQLPIVVYDFPASQASLAKLSMDGTTANRFEVYFKGIELANGFDELTDVQTQVQRFEQDNQKRSTLGLSAKPLDTHLIAALNAGLPNCAGVALGVDRLIMLALHKSSIDQVISFSHSNC